MSGECAPVSHSQDKHRGEFSDTEKADDQRSESADANTDCVLIVDICPVDLFALHPRKVIDVGHSLVRNLGLESPNAAEDESRTYGAESLGGRTSLSRDLRPLASLL